MAKQGPIKPNDVLTPDEIEAMRNFSADPRNHSMATNPPLGPLSSGTAPPAFPPVNLNQARPNDARTAAATAQYNLLQKYSQMPGVSNPMGTSTSGMFNPVANPQIPIAASQVNGANSFQFAEDAKNLSVTTKDNTKATKELTQAIKDNTEISKQSVMPAGGTTTVGTSNIATQQLGVTSTPLPINFNQTGQATASQLSQQTVQQFHQQQNNLNQQVAQQVQNRASGAYGTSTSGSAGGGNFFGAYSSASSSPVGGGSGGGFSPGAGTANMPRGGGTGVNPNQQGRNVGAQPPSQGTTTTAQYFANFRMGMAYNNAAAQAVANGQPPPSPPSGMGGVVASAQPSGSGGGTPGPSGSDRYNNVNQNASGRALLAGSSDIFGGASQFALGSYSSQGAFARTASNPVAYSGYENMQASLQFQRDAGSGTAISGIGLAVAAFNPLAGGALFALGAATTAYNQYHANVQSTASAEQQQITAYQFNRQFGYGPAFSRKTSVLDAASNIPYYGPMYQRELSTMLARGNYASLESLMPTIERNLTAGTGNDTFANRADLMRTQIDRLTESGFSVEQAYSSLAQTAASVTRRSASTASDQLLQSDTYAGLIGAGFTGQQIGSLINLNQRNAYGFGSTLSTDAQGISSGLGSRIARIGQAKEMTAVGTMGLAESVMGVGLSLANAGLTGNADQMFQSAQGFENTGFTGYQGLRAYEAYTRMKHGFAGAGQEGLASVYGNVGRSLLYAESLSETGDPLKAAQRIQRAAPQTNFARLRKLIGDDNIALQIAAASGFASADEVQYAGMAGMSAPPEAALPATVTTGLISQSKAMKDRLRQKNLYEDTYGVPALQKSISKMIQADYDFEQETLKKSKLTEEGGMEKLIGSIRTLEGAIDKGFDKIKTVIEKFEKEVGETKAGMQDISGTLTDIHDQLYKKLP